MNMKFKNILEILGDISIDIYIVVIAIIVVKNDNAIECLNNRLDSLTINNNNNTNNYSYTHITTFENKTPEEGID